MATLVSPGVSVSVIDGAIMLQTDQEPYRLSLSQQQKTKQVLQAELQLIQQVQAQTYYNL